MTYAFNDAPWSAAFISWVMNEVSKKVSGFEFPYAASHTAYAQAIRDNPIKYPFDILPPFNGTNPQELNTGDIVIINRKGNSMRFNSPSWTGFSHGDIVVEDKIGRGRAVAVGGNVSDKVTRTDITPEKLRNAFVILRPKGVRISSWIRQIAEEQAKLWKDNNWKEDDNKGGTAAVAAYWSVTGRPSFQSMPVSTLTRPSTSDVGTTPFISSLQSFHPKIQYELTRRSVATETANTYTPFIKLTSLMMVTGSNLRNANQVAWCPSLGIHGEPTVSYEDIYFPQDNKSIVAYAITEGQTGKITTPVIVSDAAKDAKNIPIPGIVKVNTERGTAGPLGVRGGLFKADISILAYSVGQVDALLRYFLRPATRVVLEMGRNSSSKNEFQLTPYNWRQPAEAIKNEFSELIVNPEKQSEFIKRYVYGNYGNYEVLIGYVVKFNLKYNKNNTYTIDLTVHSVQQFEIPTKHTGVKSLCSTPTENCNAIDILEYFDDRYSWKGNTFKQLMSAFSGQTSEVIPIKNKDASPTENQGAASTNAGTRENEYYVSWRFFIETILNDRIYGLASIFNDVDSNLSRLAFPQTTKVFVSSSNALLTANEVGYHPNLRSTNPGVMVIYNEIAQNSYDQSNEKLKFEQINKGLSTDSSDIDSTNNLYTQFISAQSVFVNKSTPSNQAGIGSLYDGVWLNTAAIKQAFMSADTVSSAISSLLNMMNAATEGYWNLQLYSTDVNNPGMHIIDMGLSKPITNTEKSPVPQPEGILSSISSITEDRYADPPKSDTPRYLYVFNRKTSVVQDGEIGSDLLDVNVEFNLPQVVAVQAIAGVGGPAQKSLLQSININELRDLTLIKNLYVTCDETAPCTEENCSGDIIGNLERRLERQTGRLSRLNEIINDDSGTVLNPINWLDKSVAALERIGIERGIQQTRKEITNLRQQQAITENPNLVNLIREYADLGTALELIELNPARMMKLLNRDSQNAEEGRIEPVAHAFNSSNLTKTVVDVTLPGIGGIGLFQSFIVDRVPSILERGFYVVTKVAHEFSPQSGWITKIQGRFRFKPDTTSTEATQIYDKCQGNAEQ